MEQQKALIESRKASGQQGSGSTPASGPHQQLNNGASGSGGGSAGRSKPAATVAMEEDPPSAVEDES